MIDGSSAPDSSRRPRYNHYRLPLIRLLFALVYRLEMLTVLRTWNVQRALNRVLPRCGGRFRLLDLGCGLADYIFHYASAYPDATFVGVDELEDNIEVCAAFKRLQRLENVTFAIGDLNRFTLQPKADIVLCITVLQYVDDVSRALKNAHDALRVGGQLILYQDVYERQSEVMSDRAAFSRGTPERQNAYTSRAILDSIASAGFVAVTYQFCQGRLVGSFEALLKSFLNVSRGHPWVAVLLAPVAAALYPLYLLALWIDYRTAHKTGEGLLVVARASGG